MFDYNPRSSVNTGNFGAIKVYMKKMGGWFQGNDSKICLGSDKVEMALLICEKFQTLIINSKHIQNFPSNL